MTNNPKSNKSSFNKTKGSSRSTGSEKSRNYSEKPQSNKIGGMHKGHVASSQPPLRPTKPKK